MIVLLFFSSRIRHTRCALVTGVQTCALLIFFCLRFAADLLAGDVDHAWSEQSPARYLGPRLWFPENASRAVRHAGWPRSTVRYQRRGSRRDRAGDRKSVV